MTNSSKTKNTDAFRKAAADYTAAQEKKEAKTPLVGVVAQPITPSVGLALLDQFMQAAETMVVFPITWMASVPLDHPIRNVSCYVLLWDAECTKTFWGFYTFDEHAVKTPEQLKADSIALDDRYWWTVWHSVCNVSGEQMFGPKVTVAELKAKFDGPKFRTITDSMYQTALVANGILDPEDSFAAKN